MRLFNFVFWSIFIALVVFSLPNKAQAESTTKKVCHTDPKTKKEVCKNVKVHKKVEGTKVPEKAPANPKSNKK
jgi:hypothetical protein